jgi:predicted kinase
VLDAVFAEEGERTAADELARRSKAQFAGVWLDAPPETLMTRIAGREGDASDATANIIGKQLGYDLGHLDWLRVDAGGTPEETLKRLRGTVPFRFSAPS